MCYISGTRQTLCRVHYWAHGKIKCTGVTPLNRLFAVCRNGLAQGKHNPFAVCPGLGTRQTMAHLPCALALHTAKNGTFAVYPCPGTRQRCVSACIFLINSVYITPIKYTMTYAFHIYVDTNPDNIRYKSIQYSNQIHTIVDTNPYNSRYNSIQQSIQYRRPNAKLHI